MQSFRPYALLVLALFFIGETMAQKKQFDYDSAWRKVDALVQKQGLTQTAQKEVDKIFAQAKKDGNDAQGIKALLYSLDLSYSTEEDEFSKSVDRLRREIADSRQPSTSILYSILASKYQSFLEEHRYELYDRTQTAGPRSADPDTWTNQDLHNEIDSLFSASIANPSSLQKVNLEQYEPLIIRGNTRYLRPTLFDLLAHRALEYYSTGERETKHAEINAGMNDPGLFAPANDFVNAKFPTLDSNTSTYKATILYQQLLSFHLKDSRPDASIDVDLERLNLMKQWSELPDKQELHKASLLHILSKNGNDSAATKATYQLANYYVELGNDENRKGNPEWQDAFSKALAICEKAYSQFPKSEGGIDCYNLSRNILSKSMQVQTENVNIPGQAFRALVTYKNFSGIYFRLINVDGNEWPDRYDQLFWKKMINLKNLKSWKQELPSVNDYRSHSAEIKIDALPAGQYILLSSVQEDFNLDKNTLAVQYFHVSNISYVNNSNNYFVLHRETGAPLDGAKIQVWKQAYNAQERKYVDEKSSQYTTDKNGFFSMKNATNVSNNFKLEINWKKDHYFQSEYQYAYYNSENPSAVNEKSFEKDNGRIWLFTDRSLYRPGQLVYFKGIAVTKDFQTRRSKLWQSAGKLELELYNTDDQKIDSVLLEVNEFGSMNGRFKLPGVGITGQFYIVAKNFENSRIQFNVEDYKRPKFYVEMDKTKGGYRVNDSIQVTGIAKAYAGNMIDGAKLKYRVRRVPRFIYSWLYRGKGMPSTKGMEIIHGESATDAQGKFVFSFKAIPDLSLDSTLDPIFDYQIDVDVTDLNGETRSANSSVQVGYKSLQLNLDLDINHPIALDSFRRIKVASQNMAGERVAVPLLLKIFKLVPPNRLIRERLWPTPDQFVYNEAEFVRYFPHDEYRDEKEIENWRRDAQIINDEFIVIPSGWHDIDSKKFGEGFYVAELSGKDSSNRAVKQLAYFQLYNSGNSSPVLGYDWSAVEKGVAQPGEKLKYLRASSADNLFLIQVKDYAKESNRSPEYSFITLNKEKKAFEFLATENDRGGFGISQFFVKDNRFYSQQWIGYIPWTNKELAISFETFRDKLEPGSNEKWRLKIKGEKTDALSAEMLLNMYDASLDQFYEHSWQLPYLWPFYSNYGNRWQAGFNFDAAQAHTRPWNEETKYRLKEYDRLAFVERHGATKLMLTGKVLGMVADANAESARELEGDSLIGKMSYTTSAATVEKTKIPQQIESNEKPFINIRKNFNETAFFLPDLKTDADGTVSFSFTMPEALTQWKLMAFAHTKDLSTGYAQKMVVTQKQLMVQPNAPRFLRNGDTISFSTKIVNLSDSALKGEVQLQLFDAATNQPVDHLFSNTSAIQPFTLAAGQSSPVQFALNIPSDYSSALSYRIIAKAGNYSDGEESAVPVLPNRMLVTESITMPMTGAGTKPFKFEKLLQSAKTSGTLSQHSLTVEYTANPVWYAVQSLPYLMEFPYECAEQTFSRFYANALATAIANSNPGIKKVWEQWKNVDSSALLSNLQKNEELKSALLQETPWVMEARSESQQKMNLGLLFNIARMNNEMKSSLSKLAEAQLSNGGFSWFKGGRDDRYITQVILAGLGKLERLNAIHAYEAVDGMTTSAINYADKRLADEYNALKKSKIDLKKNNLSFLDIQYLYTRSFYARYPLAKGSETALAYYKSQAKQFWLSQNRYMQGMIALALFRSGDVKTAKAILASLKENSVFNEELGRYFKDNRGGYYWQQAPIETQSLLIEAFSEISKDEKTVNELKTWLLKQKQTNHWSSTKSTADACYALLLKGTKWQENPAIAEILMNGRPILNTSGKDGLGYAKTIINANEVKPDLGNITVNVRSANTTSQPGPSWGTVYWQYFENLDKITAAVTPLSLVKKLFIETNTNKGPLLNPVGSGTQLRVGDKIKVRIELRVDRDMEYMHLKDMRASSMEPLNVLSGYKWQGGLGYYESTRDAATNFFFAFLPKGTYVFEYPVFITHTGNFSVGVANIQCMYAPEFSSHSDGVRVRVK